MTAPDISVEAVEAVEAVGYEHDDGTLYGHANHKSYEGNPGAIPVRIIREHDYNALRAALTERDGRIEELESGLRTADNAMTCSDDESACYCPNCDRSKYRARDALRAIIAKGGEVTITSNARHLLNERLDSAALAELWSSYGPKTVGDDPARAVVDLQRLWWEVDTLRFDLSGQRNRADLLKEQLEDLQQRYWTLQMAKVPGGPV